MKYAYYITDVFTNQLFNGAQIAVIPNADGLTSETMLKIAQEFNLTETVFIFHPNEAAVKHRTMRIFTPTGEINFAGHPVIAAAFVLASCGNIPLIEPIETYYFEQNAGSIEVNITNEQGDPVFVQFTRAVSAIIDRFAPTDIELAGFLGLQATEIDHLKYTPRLISCGVQYLVVPVWNYQSVRNAKFNYSQWSQSIAPQTAAQEILLFSGKTPYPDSDFNVRLLGPNISIFADPPVGSAMPAFASYLCSFEHTRMGTYTFSVDRGDQHSRRSVLSLEMDYKVENHLTLRVGGKAVLFAQGLLNVPD